MSTLKSNHLLMFTAALALAGCSSALSQEAVNTAVISQQGPELMASLNEQTPAEIPPLDGAPQAVAPLPPVVEAPPPVVVAPPPVVKSATPPARAASARLSCVIDVDRTARGIRITPVVKSGRALSGEYSLVITKDGAGGSSDINQGGPFEAGRGERVELGSSEISLERGARYRAVLKVRADGREICREISS